MSNKENDKHNEMVMENTCEVCEHDPIYLEFRGKFICKGCYESLIDGAERMVEDR